MIIDHLLAQLEGHYWSIIANYQALNDDTMARNRREMQTRPPLVVIVIDLGAVIEKQRYHVNVTCATSHV